MPFLDRLYAAATQMTCDRADADNLVQQTYLRAFDAFGSFAERTSLKVWLFRILADTALGASGERQRPQGSDSSTGRAGCRLPGERHPRFPVPRTPRAQALDRLPDRDVRATLRQLPRELAIVVYLADVEDFPPAEVADVLGISPSTATSRLHHGRQRLLRLLTDVACRRGLFD
ncbi:sigma-70 family RNA polymerase sigma factor [Streptomyces sp. NPDC001970]